MFLIVPSECRLAGRKIIYFTNSNEVLQQNVKIFASKADFLRWVGNKQYLIFVVLLYSVKNSWKTDIKNLGNVQINI